MVGYQNISIFEQWLAPYKGRNPRITRYSGYANEVDTPEKRIAYHESGHAVAIDLFNKSLLSR